MIAEYVGYLQYLGLRVVLARSYEGSAPVGQQRSRQNRVGYFAINQRDLIPSKTVYLHKALTGGVILVEVCTQSMFICVDMFSMHTYHGRGAARVRLNPQTRQAARLFTVEAAKFKNFLHVNSFLYDFHVRSFRELLTAASAQAGTPAAPRLDVPARLAPFDVIDTFLLYYTTTPTFCRNRLFSSRLQLTLEDAPVDLASYIASRAAYYGFHSMRTLNVADAVFGTFRLSDLRAWSRGRLGDSHEPGHSGEGDSSFMVSIIVRLPHSHLPQSQLVSSNASYCVEWPFYVLLTHPAETFPLLTAATPMRTELAGLGVPFERASADEYAIAVPTADELTRIASEKLDLVIREARVHYRRDFLWQSLLQPGSSSGRQSDSAVAERQQRAFVELLSLATVRPLASFDARLPEVLNLEIPWDAFIAMLQTRLPAQRVRILGPAWPDDGRSMCAYMDAKSSEHFCLITYDATKPWLGPKIDLVVRQSPLTADVAKVREAERAFVDEFVNHLCCYLWCKVEESFRIA